jgi:hypothetical protein
MGLQGRMRWEVLACTVNKTLLWICLFPKPFGIGPRVCVGQHFAMAETVLGPTSMLRRFRFSLVSSVPAEVNAWISLRPKERIELRVEQV